MVFWECASIKLPPGGDKDETPPEIVSIDPPTGSVNLINREIAVKFSEYMDENSFKVGVNVFPKLNSPIETEFRGDEIFLTLPDTLDDDKTYIIYLNRNIKDEHGIQLSNTFQLAYSTGDKISSGTITGQIYSTGPASVHLWKINSVDSDSILFTEPEYVTDMNKDGTYSFGYLSAGEYKVLAVDKSSAGLPLNTNRSGYGLFWQESINLADRDTLSNVNIRMNKEPQELKLLRGRVDII